MYLLLRLHVSVFCHLIVLQLVPADGIPGSDLSSSAVK